MFKFIDRNHEESLILIPGWAFDYRIFDTLDLKYNYFIFNSNSMNDFESELKNIIEKNNLKKISLFGWSQGAFLACDFAGKNPGLIEEVILVGAKQKYEKEGLDNIKKYILKIKRAYLYKFYVECFCRNEKDYFKWFKKNLLKGYLANMDSEDLINTLDWISQKQIKPEYLNEIKKITFIHGEDDRIAPVNEMIVLKEKIKQAKFIIFENTGHIPFLRKDFKDRFYAD